MVAANSGLEFDAKGMLAQKSAENAATTLSEGQFSMEES